jgi:hypothetical protein
MLEYIDGASLPVAAHNSNDRHAHCVPAAIFAVGCFSSCAASAVGQQLCCCCPQWSSLSFSSTAAVASNQLIVLFYLLSSLKMAGCLLVHKDTIRIWKTLQV